MGVESLKRMMKVPESVTIFTSRLVSIFFTFVEGWAIKDVVAMAIQKKSVKIS